MFIRHRCALILVLSSIVTFFVAGSLAAAQSQRPALTMEWIFSDQASKLAAVPDFRWLADNTAILCDARQPEAQRTFEKFDPSSRQRHPALDMSLTTKTVGLAPEPIDTMLANLLADVSMQR